MHASAIRHKAVAIKFKVSYQIWQGGLTGSWYTCKSTSLMFSDWSLPRMMLSSCGMEGRWYVFASLILLILEE